MQSGHIRRECHDEKVLMASPHPVGRHSGSSASLSLLRKASLPRPMTANQERRARLKQPPG
jgi:hypothetical protein